MHGANMKSIDKYLHFFFLIFITHVPHVHMYQGPVPYRGPAVEKHCFRYFRITHLCLNSKEHNNECFD